MFGHFNVKQIHSLSIYSPSSVVIVIDHCIESNTICPTLEPSEMVISDCVPSPPLGPHRYLPPGSPLVPPGPPQRKGRGSPLYPDYIFNAQHPSNSRQPCSHRHPSEHYVFPENVPNLNRRGD